MNLLNEMMDKWEQDELMARATTILEYYNANVSPLLTEDTNLELYSDDVLKRLAQLKKGIQAVTNAKSAIERIEVQKGERWGNEQRAQVAKNFAKLRGALKNTVEAMQVFMKAGGKEFKDDDPTAGSGNFDDYILGTISREARTILTQAFREELGRTDMEGKADAVNELQNMKLLTVDGNRGRITKRGKMWLKTNAGNLSRRSGDVPRDELKYRRTGSNEGRY